MIRRLPAIAVAGMLTLAGTASASDWDLTVVGGFGNDQIRKAGVVLGATRPEPLWQGERWRLMLRHEVELSLWRVPQARDLAEFGYSPVLRFERPLGGRTAFFVEASIGARLLSHTRLSPTRSVSTAFQFSDQLGVGLQWGESGNQAAGVRLQHISNGGIKKPNPGVNFGQIYYRLRF